MSRQGLVVWVLVQLSAGSLWLAKLIASLVLNEFFHFVSNNAISEAA